MRAPALVAFASAAALFSCGPERSLDRAGADPAYGQMQQAATVCAAGTTVQGLDVSSYQGDIDWDQVVGAGKVFAITRIGDGLGSSANDSYFAANWAAIQAHGLVRGSYQYFRTGDDPIAQADVVVAAVGTLGPGDLPVACDVEEASPSLSPAGYTAALHQWSDRVAQGTGKTPFIYTGGPYWNSNVQTTDFADVPLWHAQYTTAACPNIADAWSTWTFWQYEADPYPQYGIPGGTCPGVTGYVDLDVFNGSLDDLNALANVVVNQDPTGNLDSAGCDAIVGWAQDPDDPTTGIDVQVYFDGAPGDPAAVGFTINADLYRSDLCTPLGSCSHGFSLPTPYGFQDGQSHVVHVFAVDSAGGNTPEVAGSPQTLSCPLATPPVPPASGVKRLVDAQTLANWGFASTDLVTLPDAQLDSYPQGPDLTSTPQLVQAAGDQAIYLLEYKTLRQVVDDPSMTAWHFDYGQIQSVTAADLAQSITGAALLARPFLAQGSDATIYVIDSPPPLWAVPISNDAPSALATDQAQVVTFQLQNLGAIAWEPGEVFLAPTNPRDHDSPLCDPDTWESCQRAVSVDSEAQPGDTANFVVTLRAPSSDGTVSECFNLVYEDSFWFSDVGQMGPDDSTICFSIDVSEPIGGPDAGPIVQPGEDAGAVVFPGEDAGSVAPSGMDASSANTGLDASVQATTSDAGGLPPSMNGGCGCASTSGSAWTPIALALLALVRRRR